MINTTVLQNKWHNNNTKHLIQCSTDNPSKSTACNLFPFLVEPYFPKNKPTTQQWFHVPYLRKRNKSK